MSFLLPAIAAYTVATYLADVPLRREAAAREARRVADASGLPLLNIGAGTSRTALFGATLYGDINVDVEGRRDVPHGTPGVVTYADAEDLPFETGSIGAVLASHVLEHVRNPARAISEWLRVTASPKGLFIITPSWWAPHTWLHPEHRWWFPDRHGGLLTGEMVPLRGL